ncbi:MAG: PEGA domain-containing protein [Myxococcota bacterium]
MTAVALFLGTGAPAAAQETGGADAQDAAEGAREEFMRGQQAYQQGDYETAIAAWQAAYELDPRPLILYNLSQAYERYGKLSEAVQALEKYTSEADPSDPNVETARSRLSKLRERLGRTGIHITDAPGGAEILVDGHSWGRAPREEPIPLDPGTHRVVLRLEGYEDFRASVGVPAGQTIDVAAEMDPETAAAGEAAGQGPGIAPWLLVGGGGGVLVTGAILGGVALGKAKDAEFRSGGEADGAETLALVADVMMGVGAAAAVGGFLWWLLTRRGGDEAPAEEAPAVSLNPVFGPGAAGAEATLRF